MGKKQKFFLFLTIGIIFLSFILLRFYNLEKRIGFGWDQEQFSYQIKRIVVDHKLTLLGPRVNNDQGFFLAPYLTYLLVPFYITSNLHPKALIYFVVIFNILFFWSSFFIIKKIFGDKIAIFFLAFWAINPYLIDFDIIPWWPISIPVGVIFVWYMLYRAYKAKSKSDYFILGLILGFFNNMHSQFVFLFLFSLLFLIFMNFLHKKIPLKNFIFLISGYILLFTPLFVFDLRHNFLNTKAFYQFFFAPPSSFVKESNVWWLVFSNFLQPLFFYQNNILIIKLFYVFILFLLVFLIKKERSFNKIFFFATFFLWLIFPLFFIFYGQRPSEYYFIFLYPFIYVTIIRLFTLINKNLILVIFLISFLVLEKGKIRTVLKDNLFGLYYKDQTAKKLKGLTYGKKFNISFNTPLGRNHGFSYLLDWYQIKQTGDFKDPLVEIRIPPRKGDMKINEEIGVKIPKELR